MRCFIYERFSASTDDPLRDDQVGHPAKPGDNEVSGQETEMQELRKGQIQAQGDGRESKRVISDHPFLMLVDIQLSDSRISHDISKQPGNGKGAKTHYRDKAAGRKKGDAQTRTAAHRDSDHIYFSDPPVHG